MVKNYFKKSDQTDLYIKKALHIHLQSLAKKYTNLNLIFWCNFINLLPFESLDHFSLKNLNFLIH